MTFVEVEICPDNHRCENGSKCVEKENDEDVYECDCDQANDGAYVGLYCEHEATVYCTEGNVYSKSTFCTNDGACKQIISGNGGEENHLGCLCPDGYVGDHCQFVKGTSQGDIYEANSHNALPGGAMFVIVFGIAIAVIGGLLYGRKEYVKKLSERKEIDFGDEEELNFKENLHAPQDLNLEMDGEILQEAVKAQTPEPSPMAQETNEKEIGGDII